MSAIKAYYKERFYYKITVGMRLEMGMEGYRRSYSSTKPEKLPFGPELMRLLGTELLEEGGAHSLIMWGCALLGFFSLCRAGETFGPFKPEDADHILKWKNLSCGYGITRQERADKRSKWVDVHFDSHKGDRYKKGCTVRLGKVDDPMLCPIKAIRWIQKGRDYLGLRNIDNSRVSEVGKGVVIHRQKVINRIKKVARSQGMDSSRFSGHSLRVGGATQLMAAGFDAEVIKLIGRWKSDCYTAYLHLNPSLAETVAMNILHV